MFGFKKKKKEAELDQAVYAPVTGECQDITTASDPVFAQKMMGDGFLVHPNSGSVVAPVAGEITVQQGHALGIKRADGLEFLLHIGIDTVSLKGAPFTQHVGVKDVVNPGDLLVDVDWQQIKDANLDSSVMVIITNTNDLLAQLEVKYGNVSAGAKVGTATAK